MNSFGPAIFFSLFSRMWLSIGGAKSQNEFAAPDLYSNKLQVVVTEKFENSKFPWKVEDLGRFGALNR